MASWCIWQIYNPCPSMSALGFASCSYKMSKSLSLYVNVNCTALHIPKYHAFHQINSSGFMFSIYICKRIIKNISNKNDRICRDVKTQKVCEQGRDG